jgi:DNA-binding NarL/FixJ family response regulator
MMLPKPEGPQGIPVPRRRRVHPAALRIMGPPATRHSEPARPRLASLAEGTAPIGIAVVDADALTRDGIGVIVSRQQDMRLLTEADDVSTAVARLAGARPDVVFIEAWLASENEGAAVRVMLGSLPTAKIIAFGPGRCEEEAFHVLNAGASGYVIRSAIKTELVPAIRWTRADHLYVPAEIQRLLAARQRRPPLTPRERGVLELLVGARSNATIAAVLGISVGTVKLHVKSILAKLGVEDRGEAALAAMERGFSRFPRLVGV